MNHRLTHALVSIVAAALIVAAVAFSFVVTVPGRPSAGTKAARSVIPPIAHPVDEDMSDCVRCHVPGQKGTSPSHATYGGATCLTCHQVAPTGAPRSGD